MTIYSDRLALDSRTGPGTWTLFTVPAGRRYVVRSITITNVSTASSLAVLYGPTGLIRWLTTITGQLAVELDVRWVYRAGEALTWAIGDAHAWTVHVDGYDLTP